MAILLRPPTASVTYDEARVRGNPQAAVTIVEFSDFQCPFCKKSEGTLREVLSQYQGQVKLAYRDFPLREIHPQAQQAAEAARCAGEQGKFWEYHDALFSEQSKLDESGLFATARQLGLNESRFRSCLNSGEYRTQVEADLQDGARLGVGGTPAYFVNGVLLTGAQPKSEFDSLIKNALSALELTQ